MPEFLSPAPPVIASVRTRLPFHAGTHEVEVYPSVLMGICAGSNSACSQVFPFLFGEIPRWNYCVIWQIYV